MNRNVTRYHVGRHHLLHAFVATSALLILLAPDPVAARAGGGEAYRGSGSSGSGSSSSGSSSSGSSSRSTSDWSSSAPATAPSTSTQQTRGSSQVSSGGGGDVISFRVLGVVALLLIAIALVHRARERSTQPHGQTRSAVDRMQALPDLLARDPSFDRAAFVKRAERAFLAIQDAWFRRRLDETRALMSDGVYRRFVVLQRLMEREGRRDALDGVSVAWRAIVAVSTGGPFDAVAVQVQAHARDTDVPSTMSDDEARAEASRAQLERFTEVWTFVRRRDATTRHDLSQGACPNCGAPFRGGATNRCDHCSAIVNSGAFDWVLTEISQQLEGAADLRERGDVRRLRERDSALSGALLEDRASLLFWKWVEAVVTRTAAPLRKVATTETHRRVQAALETGSGPRPFRLPAVGGVEVADVTFARNGRDVVRVDVEWSAADDAATEPRHRQATVVMSRPSDATTDRGVGLSSDRCHACGAASTDSDAATCEWCGTSFSDSTGWLLEDVVERG